MNYRKKGYKSFLAILTIVSILFNYGIGAPLAAVYAADDVELPADNQEVVVTTGDAEQDADDNQKLDEADGQDDNSENLYSIPEELDSDEEIVSDEEVSTSDQVSPLELAEEVTIPGTKDRVMVTLSAKAGVLPMGTSLSAEILPEEEARGYAEALAETGEVLENYLIFDITLLDKEGNEVQPNGDVEVGFTNLPFVQDAEEVSVYHLELGDEDALNDNNPKQTSKTDKGIKQNKESNTNEFRTHFKSKNMQATKNKKNVKFSTNHFSIYAVGTTPTATYEFYNGATKVDTQIVKNGEKLLAPQVADEINGKKFTGWYVDGETEPINFNNAITVNSTPEEPYRVEAKYDGVFYVYFKYNNDIITTKEVAPNVKTDDTGVSLDVVEPGKAFSHWSTSENGGAFDFDNTTIAADITLHAVLVDRWKVTFDSQGGSQVLPKYIVHDGKLDEVDATERVGYTFDGWYTQVNGKGSKYTNNTKITGNITLYAKWEANTNTGYSLVYWLENANDEGHTYKETVAKTGTTGTTIEVALNDRSKTRYTYFTYERHETGETIKGDGTTVVNVYYSRNFYVSVKEAITFKRLEIN